MPIRIPNDLPAFAALEAEGVMVMREADAVRQDIRPLQIGLLNLMPNKIRTETQIARLLGASPLQVELTLIKMTDHVPKNVPQEHMISFYEPWSDLRERKFDGLVVTGAPVERLPFEEVSYWSELCQIFDWTQTHVHSSFMICWGAQAALHHFHDVPKHELPKKAFGVYRHRNLAPASGYLRGFSDDFSIPVSRWTETRVADVPPSAGIRVLMDSPEMGPCLMEDRAKRSLYMFNHIEYDSDSLGEEYQRDVGRGMEPELPHSYFTDDDPTHPPLNRWRSHAHLLFANWINEIYQTTPFDVCDIGTPVDNRQAG
ncbi:homoserine O-succinyltransferase [Nisaea acidiphila]|uniref:Homoserine O-acetyltransferase n=1 Tax=Nisaea acidiphila TaxID=1862145 RepID=A0A9J7ASL0_9PROT|nr:homoserine O-succinyltransferase [Nisaea acidiphila]UUX49332.1 homoserine O-succinyltransferase [Nisaea acidiphila]